MIEKHAGCLRQRSNGKPTLGIYSNRQNIFDKLYLPWFLDSGSEAIRIRDAVWPAISLITPRNWGENRRESNGRVHQSEIKDFPPCTTEVIQQLHYYTQSYAEKINNFQQRTACVQVMSSPSCIFFIPLGHLPGGGRKINSGLQHMKNFFLHFLQSSGEENVLNERELVLPLSSFNAQNDQPTSKATNTHLLKLEPWWKNL